MDYEGKGSGLISHFSLDVVNLSKKGDKMICSIWSGPMYGIYIGFPNRNKYFKEEFQNDVRIQIGDKVCRASLPPSFWNQCPEIRVARDDTGRNCLSEWIKENKLMPPTISRQKKGKEDKVVLKVVEPYKTFWLFILEDS